MFTFSGVEDCFFDYWGRGGWFFGYYAVFAEDVVPVGFGLAVLFFFLFNTERGKGEGGKMGH